MDLSVIFEDEHIVAINKPSGLLVHRTSIAAEETVFAVQLLRDQIGQRVSPVHRLDRPTSGVLLFAKQEASLPLLKLQFAERTVKKTYLAIVRGIPKKPEGIIDHALTAERSNKLQEAKTGYRILQEAEIPFNTTGRYPTSRYSLLELTPETGRTHQIRRHLAHIRHYILGDKKHGDNKQNQFFEKQFGLENLLLHAGSLTCEHPVTHQNMLFKAPVPVHFRTIMQELGWDEIQF